MDVKEIAYWKAVSKIESLQRESINYATLIVNSKTELNEEQLISCLKSTDRELETWQYILKLIKDNRRIY